MPDFLHSESRFRKSSHPVQCFSPSERRGGMSSGMPCGALLCKLFCGTGFNACRNRAFHGVIQTLLGCDMALIVCRNGLYQETVTSLV